MSRYSLRKSLSTVLGSNDRGVALPMVLMVFLVGIALIGAFLVAIVGSSTVTTIARDSVQAEAAAEAGVSAAVATLAGPAYASTSFCTSPAQSLASPANSTPAYSVTITCDSVTSPTSATITSEGEGPDGTSAIIEAVFPVTAGSGSAQTVVRQRSILIGSGDISALKPVSGDPNLLLSLTIPNGDYSCWSWNAREIPGDLFVPNGKVDLGTAGCKVGGNVYALGAVNVQDGASVGGNVISASSQRSTVQSGGRVAGNMNVAGTIAINNGSVGGNATSATAVSSHPNQLGGGGSVGGDFLTRGSQNTWTPFTVGGTRTPNYTGTLPATDSSVIPKSKWYEYRFEEAVWQGAGYTKVTSTCSQSDLTSKINAAVVPSYIMCTGSLSLWPGLGTLSLKTDIALVSPGGSIVNSAPTIRSFDGQPHQFSLITSDQNLTDNAPTCTSPATSMTITGVQVQSPAIMVVYTPCQLEFGSGTVRGAILAGKVNAWGSPSLVALGVSIPGLNLQVDEQGNAEVTVPGGGTPTLSGGASATPTVIRDRS